LARFMRLQLGFQEHEPKFIQPLWIVDFSTNTYPKVRSPLL